MKKLTGSLLLFVLLAIPVIAQLTTSNLTGTVSGPDGVLPGATVTVKDAKTGKEITVKTDDAGGFKVPNLQIGAYTVNISASGFKTLTADNVVLQVGQDYNIPVQLEIGGVTETVTVTAGTEIINSSDAQINGNITNKQIDSLPLLTRNPIGFIPLQAGVASNPSQLSTINGVRTSATNITIEGINVQDNFIRSNATDFSPARPLVDEVEEFTVASQNNVDKGFGAGQVQFAIRRGGNKYNGSLYEYNRNSAVAANSFFNNAAGVSLPFRNRNEFGGRIGGPLPFFNFGEGGPMFIDGKDKLFFFFLYQKTIDKVPGSVVRTVLTPNARRGIFTYTALANDPANNIVAGQTVSVNLLNPAFGTGITAINATSQNRFITPLPVGNSVDAGDQRNTTGYRFNNRADSEQNNYSTRIDYVINNNHSLKGTFRHVYQTVLRTDGDTTFNVFPQVSQPSNNPFLSIGLVSAFSSNFSNEINAGLSFSDPTFLRDNPLPNNFVAPGLVTNPEVTFQNQGRDTKGINIQDNATYTVGNHSIRFGGQVQTIRVSSFNNAGITPTYSIGTSVGSTQISPAQFTNTALFPGGVPTAQRTTANSLLALLGGIIGSSTQTFNVETQTSGFVNGAGNARNFETEIYGVYASDQWRFRPELTLNVGLRYDIYTGLRNPEGLFFEPAINGADPVQAILNPAGRYQFVGGNAGKPGQFFKTDYNNFAPNISIAYAPQSKNGIGRFLFGEKRSVFRAGYRISYINDEYIASANNAGVGNAGLSTSVGAINPLTGTTALNARIDNLPPVTTPAFVSDRTFALNNTAAFGFFGTVYAINPEIKTPFVQEYSAGFQREIGFNSAIEVRYVGTRSNSLVRAVDFNQIDIRNNNFAADFNRARSNFVLTGNAACTTAQNAGCQALTVFPNLGSGGLLTNPTITAQLVNGTPADLALVYIQNGLQGNVRFLPNPNTGVVDYLDNLGKFFYNSAQVEFRRRFAQGFFMQANYTFSKNLTNSNGSQTNGTGDSQTRFDPLLDNANPDLEYARAIFDQTHKFNFNGVYELPFGKGRRFLNNNGLLNQIFGGLTLSGVFQIGSGSPITFTDARGTLNRAGRSNRQTAVTGLTKDELKKLVGVYRTPNGIFFLPTSAINRNDDGSVGTNGRTGQGSLGFGQPTFQGQVFFNNAPGTTSGLERSIVNGPTYFQTDLTLSKRFTIGERYSFQIQADAFNVFNTVNFVPGQSQDINSTNFGRITSTFNPRVIQLAGRFNF